MQVIYPQYFASRGVQAIERQRLTATRKSNVLNIFRAKYSKQGTYDHRGEGGMPNQMPEDLSPPTIA
jgi:hypothetical protein